MSRNTDEYDDASRNPGRLSTTKKFWWIVLATIPALVLAFPGVPYFMFFPIGLIVPFDKHFAVDWFFLGVLGWVIYLALIHSVVTCQNKNRCIALLCTLFVLLLLNGIGCRMMINDINNIR